MNKTPVIMSMIGLMLIGAACQKRTTTVVTNSVVLIPLPPGYEKFADAVTVMVEGDFVVVKSNGLPDHHSPYYPRNHLLYEADERSTFRKNPNVITTQNLTFRFPKNPIPASALADTPGGPIGVALNGVPFFNQYAALGRPLTDETLSFDQYNGHPQQQGQYHYHLEPVALTSLHGGYSLLGFLLDGYPVYGPEENGVAVTNADLDTAHGHQHATADYPDGIYHYHFTDDVPYLNGVGFYGVPGTVVDANVSSR